MAINLRDQAELTKERLEAIRVPPALLHEAVAEATGSEPASIRRLSRSWSNDAYDVSTRDGQHVVVRAHRSRERHFAAECWAFERCSAAGVPVPRVLLARDVFLDEGVGSISVATRLPGEMLENLLLREGPSPEPLAPVLREAGEVLRRIHAIATERFGVVEAGGVGASEEINVVSDPRLVDDALAAVGLDRELGRSAHTILVRDGGVFDGVLPRLLHGDFAPRHVLVDGGRVSGVVDMEFPRSGDPAWDVAYWECDTGADAAPLLAGYGDVDAAFGSRQALWRLRICLDWLMYHGPRGEIGCDLRDRIRRCLERGIDQLA